MILSFIKCSLPNKIDKIVFDSFYSEYAVYEFMLLAQKKNIDISEITDIKNITDGYVYVCITENKVELISMVPLSGSCLSWSQRERYDSIKRWSEIRESFKPYIINN